jgi:branched-chain amino acid transport system ATP-binding protein
MTTDHVPALSVVDLQVRYGAPLAVNRVSFDLQPGAVLTVLGANGAGKSSIARACAGLVPPAAGQVRLGDLDITGWSPDRIRRAGLIYVPESRGIFPTLSVAENLRLAVRITSRPDRALASALEMFPILASRRRQRAGSMSGGEQQMLSLARALVAEPKVLIIDEPSLGLSPVLVEQVFESLTQAKKRGLTMILAEQFAHRALALSDRCLIMTRGVPTWSGSAQEAAKVLFEHYLGDAAPEAAQVGDGAAGTRPPTESP